MIFLLGIAAMLASLYLFFVFVAVGGISTLLGFAFIFILIYAGFEGLEGLHELVFKAKRRGRR